MKKILIMALVPLNAMALDFETEWAKFNSDFVKLRGTTVVARVEPQQVTSETLFETNTASNKVERVDPKSSKRLGRNLDNPYMRDKLEKLYNDPNIVVYSLTLE